MTSGSARMQSGKDSPMRKDAAEVGSARMLANRARDRLRDAGLDDPTIERLADRFIAEDRGEDLDAFVAWARTNGAPSDTVDEASDQSFPASDPPSSWASAGDSG